MLRRVPPTGADQWSSGAELAGHTAPVAASRFSTALYRAKPAVQAAGTDAGAEAAAAAASASTSAPASSAATAKLGVVALGGADGLVTVWRTDRPRPVAVLRHAFADSVRLSPQYWECCRCPQHQQLCKFQAKPPRAHSTAGRQVTDLAWSPAGYALLVASRDGGLLALVFGAEDLGDTLR